MAKPLPSAEELKCLFAYRPDGRLVWRERGLAAFDAMYAGRPVAENTSHKGYRKVAVGGRFVFQHRVIWKMFHGTDPDTIDHINGDRSDNRLENLRGSTQPENLRNMRPRGGRSAFKGVYKGRRGGTWGARIKVNGKTIHLGTYGTEVDAAKAYDAAAIRLHGEFSATNESFGLL